MPGAPDAQAHWLLMTRLILIRHGQTDWNRQKRIQGQLDIPLNAEGRRQIGNIVYALAHLKGIKKINFIYSSCLSRSWETADEIAKIFSLKTKRMKELNEVSQGVWEGLLEQDVLLRHKKLYMAWKTNPLSTTPPKGENIDDANKRITAGIKKAVNRHRDQVICIVTHEIASAIIKCHYRKIGLGRIWEHIPKNASLEILDV